MSTSPTSQDRFLALLEEHKGILYKVAATSCRSFEDRPDLVQEMVVQLWRSFDRYDDRYKFSTWMYRVALNVAISFHRSEARRTRHTVPAQDSILELAADAPGTAEREEDLRLLHDCIERLAPLDRALVVLYLDGNSHDAIAEILGISTTNVGTKIRPHQNETPARPDAAGLKEQGDTMDLDDLKRRLDEHDRRLGAGIRLNARVLTSSVLDKAETSLDRLSRLLWVELILNFAAAVWLGSFVAGHVSEPRFLIPAAALDLGAIVLVAAAIRQLAAIARLDYSAPIVDIQKRIGELRVERLRAVKLTLLFAPLLWVPVFVVGFEGLFGVDAFAVFGARYIAANVLFGVLVIPLAVFVSRRYADRMDRSPLVQRLMRDLAGRNLAAAAAFVGSIAAFEAEGGSAPPR